MKKFHQFKQGLIGLLIITLGIVFALYQFVSSQSPEKKLIQILETYKIKLVQIPADDTYDPIDFSEPIEILIEKTETINNAFKPLFTERGFNQFIGNRLSFIYRDYYNETGKALTYDDIKVKSITFQEELHKAVIIYTLHYHDNRADFSENNQIVFLETEEGWLIDHETLNRKDITTRRYE
jgi:hypothetical protein